MEYGLFALLIMIFDIVAIIKIMSSGVSTGEKALWVLIILLLPALGLIIWWFAGPKGGRVG